MKIAPLLAQYLYSNKRLDLTGLGTFLLDPSVTIETENNKQTKPANLEGVSFENKVVKETPDLIQYISSQTGKIKALAAADLESHLGLAQQFLNIGKPFLFEGIGSLTKTRSGEYTFASGLAIPVSIKDQPARESMSSSPTQESFHDYKSVFYPKKVKAKWRKPVAVFLLIAGLGLAIWGGYTVYKRTTAKKDIAAKEDKKEETVLITDTTALHPMDTTTAANPATTIPARTIVAPAGNYKFILETADAKRAFTRFGKLKTFQWNVQMETRDSLSYKLYMLLPASAADTTRLIDSLSMLNGKKVYIENSDPQ